MKNALSLFVLMALVGCHKDDVNVAMLEGNPFDTDHPVSTLLSLNSISTEATIPGAIWQQNLAVVVDQSRLPSPTEYQVRCIDSDGDTMVQYSSQHPDGIFLIENYQVTLGVTYCYDVQLMLGPETATGHFDEDCAIAAE